MSHKGLKDEEIISEIIPPIITLGELMKITSCNSSSLILLGIHDATTLIGSTLWETLHTDKNELLRSACFKALEEQTTERINLHLTTINKYIQLTIVGIGETVTIVFTAIAEAKFTEEKNSRNVYDGKDRFLQYASISSEWIWDWNLIKNSIWRNRSYDDIFGYHHSETVHINIWKSNVHQDDLLRVLNSVKESIEKKEKLWVCEYRFYKSNNDLIHVQDRGVILYDEDGTAYRMLGCKIDISDRLLKKATDSDNEAKYRTIFDRASDSIVIFTVNGDLIDVNAATTELTGYSYEELTRMKVPEILNTENLKENPIPFERLLAGEVTNARRPIKTKYGKEKVMDLSAKILPDGSFMTIIRDITDKSEAEMALRNSESRFRSLASNAPVGIFETNVSGETVYVNNKMIDYTGLSFDELLAESWLEAIHPEDRENLLSHWLKMFAQKRESDAEFRFLNKNGKVRWMLGKSAPLFDKGGYYRGYLGTLTDVTEERQAKEELLRSEERYRLVIEQASDAIFITDKDGIIISANKSALNLLSFSEEELLKKNIREFLNEKDLSDIPEKFVLLSSGSTINTERTIVDRNNNLFTIETSTKMLTDGRLLIFARDVTDRIRSESLLLKSYEDIRLLASHLTNVREEERKRIGREIHDELGQKLTAIKMDIAWIQPKLEDSEKEVTDSLKNIIELLDAGNLSLRRILTELRPAVMDNYGLLEAIKQLNEQFTKASKIPVDFHTSEVKLQLSQEVANCVFRVYQESLTNVMRHSNANNLTTSLIIIGNEIKVTVEDDGIGFSESEVVSNRSFGVLGMRERILSHNGKFKIVSENNKGTKVSFALSRNKI